MSDKEYSKRGSEMISPLTSELQSKKPRDLVTAMNESSSPSASASASSSSSQSSSSTIIDKNTVEEIVHTRLNQSLSNLQPPITPGQQPDAAEITSTIIKSVLPEVISTVVSAVTEVLNKFVVQLEKTHSSKNEMVMQAHIRSLTYRNDELEQYSRRESLRMFGVTEDPNETSETTEKKSYPGIYRSWCQCLPQRHLRLPSRRQAEGWKASNYRALLFPKVSSACHGKEIQSKREIRLRKGFHK